MRDCGLLVMNCLCFTRETDGTVRWLVVMGKRLDEEMRAEKVIDGIYRPLRTGLAWPGS